MERRQKKRPRLIGLTSCLLPPESGRELFKGKHLFYQERQLVTWLTQDGDLVWPLPVIQDDHMLKLYCERLDGLVLHGGSDIAPSSYGEQPICDLWPGERDRDICELTLTASAMKLGIPVLGVCRGAQLLNVALGGSLYQDLTTQLAEFGCLQHRDAVSYDHNMHDIELYTGKLLERLSQSRFRVNSVHHQGVKVLAPNCAIEAISVADGVIEAFRLNDPERFVFGVQWHPEWLLQGHPMSHLVWQLFSEAIYAKR